MGGDMSPTAFPLCGLKIPNTASPKSPGLRRSEPQCLKAIARPGFQARPQTLSPSALPAPPGLRASDRPGRCGERRGGCAPTPISPGRLSGSRAQQHADEPRAPPAPAPPPPGALLGPDFHNNQPQIFRKGREPQPPPTRKAPAAGRPPPDHTPRRPAQEGASFLKACKKPWAREATAIHQGRHSLH